MSPVIAPGITARSCPACGRYREDWWHWCPFCGAALPFVPMSPVDL